MCKLSKKDFSQTRRCKEYISTLLPQNENTYELFKKVLKVYPEAIFKKVLAATILSKEGNEKLFSTDAQKWAEQYKNEIGFLKDSISVKYCSAGKVEEILKLF